MPLQTLASPLHKGIGHVQTTRFVFSSGGTKFHFCHNFGCGNCHRKSKLRIRIVKSFLASVADVVTINEYTPPLTVDKDPTSLSAIQVIALVRPSFRHVTEDVGYKSARKFIAFHSVTIVPIISLSKEANSGTLVCGMTAEEQLVSNGDSR